MGFIFSDNFVFSLVRYIYNKELLKCSRTRFYRHGYSNTVKLFLRSGKNVKINTDTYRLYSNVYFDDLSLSLIRYWVYYRDKSLTFASLIYVYNRV